MNILRFLICNSRMSGRQLMLARHFTVWDDFHQCYAHVCKDKAEYDKLCQEVVGKQNKRFWGDVEVFNTVTGKRSKVTDIIGVLLGSELKAAEKAFEAIQPAPQPSNTPSLPGVSIQTPGDSQSGGADEAPAESKGTLSETDFAAELAANGAPPAGDVGAGQEPPQVSEDAPAADPPTPTPPAKAPGKGQKSEVRSEKPKTKPKKGK